MEIRELIMDLGSVADLTQGWNGKTIEVDNSGVRPKSWS